MFNNVKSISPFHSSKPVSKQRAKPTAKGTPKSILKPTPKLKTPHVEDFTGFQRIFREPQIKQQTDIDEILPQLRFLFNEENPEEDKDDLIELPGIYKAIKKWRIKNRNPDFDLPQFMNNKENTIKSLMYRMLDELGYYKLTAVICVKLMKGVEKNMKQH